MSARRRMKPMHEAWLNMLKRPKSQEAALFNMYMDDKLPPQLMAATLQFTARSKNKKALSYSVRVLAKSSKIDLARQKVLLKLLRKNLGTKLNNEILEVLLPEKMSRAKYSTLKSVSDALIKINQDAIAQSALLMLIDGRKIKGEIFTKMATHFLSAKNSQTARAAAHFFMAHPKLVDPKARTALFKALTKNRNISVRMAAALALEKVKKIPPSMKNELIRFLKDDAIIAKYMAAVDAEMEAKNKPPIANGRKSIRREDFETAGEVWDLAERRLNSYKLDQKRDENGGDKNELHKAIAEIEMILKALDKKLETLSLASSLYLGLYQAHTYLGGNTLAQKFLQKAQDFDPEERNPFVLLCVGEKLHAEGRNLELAKKLFLKSILRSDGTVLKLSDNPERILDLLGFKLEKGEFGYEFESLPVLASYKSFTEENPNRENPVEEFAKSYLSQAKS